MRGAVAFALALHISIENETTKRLLLTTALFILLFTIIFLGGSTLPFIKVNWTSFSIKEILDGIFSKKVDLKFRVFLSWLHTLLQILNEVFSEKKHSHRRRRSRRRREKKEDRSQVMLSKTQEMVFLSFLYLNSNQMT